MKYHFAPCFSAYATIQFECGTCSRAIVEEDIKIPDPPATTDASEGQYSECSEETECTICGHRNLIIISNGISECIVDIPESSDDAHVQVYFKSDDDGYFDQLFDEQDQGETPYQVFKAELSNIVAILESKDYSENIARMVYKQLYSSVITIMEAYLLETIVRLLFNHDVFLKQFLRTYKEFEDVKISLSKFMDTDIKKEVRKILSGVMYHNIAKVSALYLCSAGIKFKNIGKLSKAVSVRHDLVHRNGKSIDGIPTVLGRPEVKNLIELVSSFVADVESQIVAATTNGDAFFSGIGT